MPEEILFKVHFNKYDEMMDEIRGVLKKYNARIESVDEEVGFTIWMGDVGHPEMSILPK